VTPDAATTIVWLGEQGADSQTSATLSAWARSRGLVLAPPAVWVPPTIAVDLGISATIEDLLDSARDAVTARSGADVDRALAAAESLLKAHPELPNAAWLMAEVERARSVRSRLIAPTDDEAADRAWSRASALDTGRLAGPGEHAVAAAQPATITPETRASREAQVWIDGSPVAPGPIASRAGPHALVVTWRGAPIWATWIEAPPGPSTVALLQPDAAACSTADLAEAHLAGGRVSAELARCARWVVAAPGLTLGAIRIATCEEDQCGPWVDWRPSPVWSHPPPHERERRSGWPSWATWGLVGTGVAVAAGVVVAAVAASSSRSPSEVEYVQGPLIQGPPK
jgi:hypothetical protein